MNTTNYIEILKKKIIIKIKKHVNMYAYCRCETARDLYKKLAISVTGRGGLRVVRRQGSHIF
jgi:hypothetical protein